MYNKILVAVDNSDIAEQVIEVALTLARGFRGQLMLLHVLSQNGEDSPIGFVPYASSYSIDLIEKFKADWQQYQQESLQQLEAWTKRAKENNIQAELRQANGNPGRVICDVAREWQAELIIIGRR